MFRRSAAAEAPAGATAEPGPTSPSTTRRARLRRVLHWVQVVLTLAVIVFWFFELRPIGLGGDASYAIVSGKSMNPVYHTGDVVIVHRHSSYKVRDIVAYKVPKPSPQAGLEVIHRLVGGNGKTGWVVKGDNRTAADQWHPKDSDIVGSAWLHIPDAGVVVQWAHSPLAIAAVLALLAVGVVFKKAPGGEKKDGEPAPAAAAAAAAPPRLPEPEPEPEPAAGTYPSREHSPPPVPVLPPAPAYEPPVATIAAADTGELARLTAVVRALQVERTSLQAQLDATRLELDALRARLAAAPGGNGDLERQRELERSLTEALLSAAHAGAELRLQAHREAEAIIAEARERAARLEREAGARAAPDLESLRAVLAAALASLDEVSPEPASPQRSVSVVDLFEAERQRARSEGPGPA
jgi:signal peptidase